MPRRRDSRQPSDPRIPPRDRPGYHDPLAGIGGAAPAQSALTLRLVLAAVGLLFAVAGVVVFVIVEAPTWAVALLVLVALTAVVDIVVVTRRKLRGESG